MNPSLYDEVFLVLLVLSVLMLTMAMIRKRLFLGIATALYGLAIFNLHYWGFGVPFIICAAWYLVRAYRLQRELREATGVTSRYAGRANNRKSSYTATPEPNKRYTPRSNSSTRNAGLSRRTGRKRFDRHRRGRRPRRRCGRRPRRRCRPRTLRRCLSTRRPAPQHKHADGSDEDS